MMNAERPAVQLCCPGRVVEGDKDLAAARRLGLIQPLPQLLHLVFVRGPGGIPRRWRAIVVFAGPQEDEASAVEIELVDELVGRKAELLQVWNGAQHAFDLGIPPHLMIADGGEPTALEPGRAHRGVRGGQLAQQGLVHPLPVGAVENRAALTSPPDNVPAVEHELGPAALDRFHDLAGDPAAANQPEDRPAHSGKQFHVLDGCLGDPALVHRQRHDFAAGHERHDDLHQLTGGRVVGELDILPDDFFRDFLRKHQVEHFDHQLGSLLLLIRLAREVHHRS